MKLDQHLAETRQTCAAFGRRIGVSRMAVSRYARGLAIPHASIMPRIVAETGGQVTPADFYPAAGDQAAA